MSTSRNLSRLSLHRIVSSTPSYTPIRPLHVLLPFRPLLSRHPSASRHFSTSLPRQVQYTRFSNSHTYPGRPQNRDTVRKVIVFVTAAGAVYYIAHLEQVPETGRWRFMDVSPSYEATLRQTSYSLLLSEFEGKILPPHHPITRHVRRVVSQLLESSDLGSLRSSSPRKPTEEDVLWHDDAFDDARQHESHDSSDRAGKGWNLLVVDDPKIVNALTSFGTIVVFTGILPICKDEQGLAAVLGHEIGHSVARHESERYSLSKVLVVLATLLMAAGVDFGVARVLNYVLFRLPHSRTQELEADTLGMRIAAKACFDPQSAVEMHARLARAENGGIGSKVEFLRTHPLPERRIKHLEELVPEAYEMRAASPRCAGVRDSIEQFLGSMNRWS